MKTRSIIIKVIKASHLLEDKEVRCLLDGHQAADFELGDRVTLADGYDEIKSKIGMKMVIEDALTRFHRSITNKSS